MDCSNESHMLSDDKMKPLDMFSVIKKGRKVYCPSFSDAHITQSGTSFRYELVEMVYFYLSIHN